MSHQLESNDGLVQQFLKLRFCWKFLADLLKLCCIKNVVYQVTIA